MNSEKPHNLTSRNTGKARNNHVSKRLTETLSDKMAKQSRGFTETWRITIEKLRWLATQPSQQPTESYHAWCSTSSSFHWWKFHSLSFTPALGVDWRPSDFEALKREVAWSIFPHLPLQSTRLNWWCREKQLISVPLLPETTWARVGEA